MSLTGLRIGLERPSGRVAHTTYKHQRATQTHQHSVVLYHHIPAFEAQGLETCPNSGLQIHKRQSCSSNTHTDKQLCERGAHNSWCALTHAQQITNLLVFLFQPLAGTAQAKAS